MKTRNKIHNLFILSGVFILSLIISILGCILSGNIAKSPSLWTSFNILTIFITIMTLFIRMIVNNDVDIDIKLKIFLRTSILSCIIYVLYSILILNIAFDYLWEIEDPFNFQGADSAGIMRPSYSGKRYFDLLYFKILATFLNIGLFIYSNYAYTKKIRQIITKHDK